MNTRIAPIDHVAATVCSRLRSRFLHQLIRAKENASMKGVVTSDRHRVRVVGYVVAIFLAACTNPAVMPTDVLAEKVRVAQTPADHEEIARLYEQEAETASNAAKLHQAEGRRYRDAPTRGSGRVMADHCDNIAAQYRAIAEEKNGLAQVHRDMAKQAQK